MFKILDAKNSSILNIYTILAGCFAIINHLNIFGRNVAFYDYSFILNVVTKLNQGQIPYKDFDLPLPVGTFILPWLISETTRASAADTIFILTLILTGIGAVISVGIVKNITKGSRYAKVYLAISCLGFSFFSLSSIYTAYFYDNLAALLCLILIFRLIQNSGKINALSHYLTYGLILSGLTSIKYNVAFFVMIFLIVYTFTNQRKSLKGKKNVFKVICILVLPSILVIFVHFIYGGQDFVDQTIVRPFALKNVGSSNQLSQYHYDLLIVLILAIFLILFLRASDRLIIQFVMGAITFFSLVLLFRIWNGELFKWESNSLVPHPLIIFPIVTFLSILMLKIKNCKNNNIVLLSISIIPFGFYLSQGWFGSSYALAHVLLLFFINLSLNLEYDSAIGIKVNRSVILLFVVAIPLFFWFAQYVLNAERLNYVNLQANESKVRSNIVKGIQQTQSDWKNLESLQHLLKSEKSNADILILPAEDSVEIINPTARQWGRCVQLNNLICDSMDSLEIDMIDEPPLFVLIKKKPQLITIPEPKNEALTNLAKICYSPRFENELYLLYELDFNSKNCLKNQISVK